MTSEMVERQARFLEEALLRIQGGIKASVALSEVMSRLEGSSEEERQDKLLHMAADALMRNMGFSSVALLLVDEQDNDLRMAHVLPEESRESMEREVAVLIDDMSMAWALRRHTPVRMRCAHSKNRIVLRSVASVSRVRGMVVGVLESGTSDEELMEVEDTMLSLLVMGLGNALESMAVYAYAKSRDPKLSGME